MRRIIVAYGIEREIGRDGRLPWQGDMPSEMEHFRNTTIGSSVVMGKSTYESIGRPLQGRYNIVVTRSLRDLPGCFIARSIEEALDRGANETIDTYVIGGSQIYSASIGMVDEVIASEIQHYFPGSDTYFPPLDKNEWAPELVTSRNPDAKNKFGFNVIRYTRVYA